MLVDPAGECVLLNPLPLGVLRQLPLRISHRFLVPVLPFLATTSLLGLVCFGRYLLKEAVAVNLDKVEDE